MNRLSGKNNQTASYRKIFRFLPLLLGIAVVVIFIYGVNYIGSSSLDKQEESLENALTRDIAECYAVEGSYPPSLDYIEDYYGLTYNEDLFFVDYQAIGSNIYPDITVIRLTD